jgi:hypothetical protein
VARAKIERTAQRCCPGYRKGTGGGGEGETSSELESSGENEEDVDEGEIIIPHSLLPENLSSPSDLFGR